ncbi:MULTISPECIES: cyclic di-GMP phosphodiesterase [Tenebrionibacter/Tenebrionicola group]|jgi:EAL domain-containing protein (putative c-di-GMP-specific phosphodiesterase class I)|uniref:cyclic di-GMP phosphodiesterase n=1 Tax=Tenebrionibacter/Tenebrionicola group TaxID=2969848 RepID=UPI001EE82D78|nr:MULTISPECIES: cyclic di-GMP phosphodiesterase [Tenebrionibacter/Tenebrionicola group]
MSSTTIFSRSFSTSKRILLASILLGLLCALLTGGATCLWLRHERQANYNALTRDIQNYMRAFFNDISITANAVMPLTDKPCHQASAQLTYKAAFNVHIRALLLVRDGIVYCSSATGDMQENLHEIMPELDPGKDLSLALLSGTPMLPTKPAIAIWYRNPDSHHRGVFATLNINLSPYLLYTTRQHTLADAALIIGDNALATFSPHVIPVKSLKMTPTRKITLPGYPVSVWLFVSGWTWEEIALAALVGLGCGLAFGLTCGGVFSLRQRSGKEILTGINRGQFYPVYQPIVEAKSLKTAGVEVLLRWQHPSAGTIPPDAFISFAEAQNLIAPLTRHLFELIAADAPTLCTLLPEGTRLGINLAPGHLHSPAFKDDILRFSASLPKGHFQIVLEITERDMLKGEEAPALFDWLHRQGFEIAIDDFGTGHSALIYLERFQFDYLKIDRGFVNAIGQDTVTAPVLDAVLMLAERLNMTTVAEGVENAEQAKWLIDRGVNYLQGYWFSRPLTLMQLRRRESGNAQAAFISSPGSATL